MDRGHQDRGEQCRSDPTARRRIGFVLLTALTAMALGPALTPPARAAGSHHHAARVTASLIHRDAVGALRRGGLRVRLVGRAGLRVRVILTLAPAKSRRRGRASLAAGLPVSNARFVHLNQHRRASVVLRLNAAGRRSLRIALARCNRLTVLIHALGHHLHVDSSDRLIVQGRCGRPGRHGAPGPSSAGFPGAPATPAGGLPGSAAGGGSGGAFEVGAAVGDFSPPLRGQAPGGDASDCAPSASATFSGPRKWAFMEPYTESTNSGHYAGPPDATSLVPGGPPNPNQPPKAFPGDPFLDCNQNGRWEGNLIGGGGGDPRFYTLVADPVTSRAMVVSNAKQTIAVEVVDQEGLFNVYQDQIRARVRSDGFRLDSVFISATHDESAPDSLGLGGVNPTTSGVNDYWIPYFVAKSAEAIEDSYRAMRPATIRYTDVLEPPNVRQCWSSYPYVDNQHMPVLQAVGSDGKTIVTLADVSQHTETLGFNNGSARDSGGPTLATENSWLTGDWPYFFRSSIERHFGGVAIEMAGSVGSVESPQVYPSAIPRVPQEYLDTNHPAGCRTEFDVNGHSNQDVAGAQHVPLGYHGETQAFGEQLASPVIRALDSGGYSTSVSNDIWGDRASVCVPEENLLFTAAASAGVFDQRPAYNSDCSVAVPPARNGSTTGTALKTSVAAFRIGDGEFISIPGEVFPFTYLRGFQGPADMPNPTPPLPPWLIPHMHTPFRFIDGLGEDMIGYIFPRGNAVGVPTQSDPNPSGDDRFGCHHSDDSEAASAQSGDLLGNALVPLLDHRGGRAEIVLQGRYVLPDGTLSRDPLGGVAGTAGRPTGGELKCDGANRDNVFISAGPAIGVELADGTVVHPTDWMSLGGLPQSTPDRDTRGYFDDRGARHWLDVYPDLNLG